MKTWTHAATEKLWLRDFLPLAIPNARIMTFGYDARVVDSRSILGIMENANSLLTHLGNYRNSRDLKVCVPFTCQPEDFGKLICERRPGLSSLSGIA